MGLQGGRPSCAPKTVENRARVATKEATVVAAAIIGMLGAIPKSMLKSLTFDNGKEFAESCQLEQALGLKVYFAKPYHSWERGTNENRNGIVRMVLPKGRPVIDNNRNLRMKPALQAQSSSVILRRALKEVLASTVYATSVAMTNGWRAIMFKMRRYILYAALVMLLAVPSPCGATDDRAVRRSADPVERKEAGAAADLKGCLCATIVGAAMEEVARTIQPDLRFQWFNDYSSAVEALLCGKVDVLPMDEVIARQWVAHRPGELRISVRGGKNPYGYFLAKGSPLFGPVNAELRKMIADGTVRRLIDKWSDAPDISKVVPEPLPPISAAAAKLRIVSSCCEEPGAFVRDGETVGFDIDILGLIAARLDRRLEVVKVPHVARIDSVKNGKADVGFGCITITEERKKSVDFTDCYHDGGFAMLVGRGGDGGIRTPADLRGKRVAHMSSDFHKRELKALQPDIVFDPYSEFSFAIESLRKGKIDAISLGRTYADIWMAKFPGEFLIAFDYADDVIAFLFPKGSGLREKVNAELRRMNATGETAEIVRKWLEGAKAGKTPQMPAFPPPPEGAPEVRVACAAQIEPLCFVADGVVSGAEIEMLSVVADRLGLRLRPKIYNWGGMVDCVNAGRCEIANGGIYTNGGEFPTVDVSEKYMDERMCILVRNPKFRGGGTFLASLRESFVRTFVTESRWKMMASGLGITLLITVLSVILGTSLAFPLWLARTSRNGFVSACAKGYVSLLQGTPVLVLLMVLFYLVFGKVDLDGIWIAVIGFALNSSAYFGEMLRSGIDSIPRGQTEAALALGYAPRRAFLRFVLPQAVRAILPVYRGEIISVLKSTSIVGYIAINDLTKASDLVRSRTYESFFPILTTAFVYFAAAWILARALDRLGRRLDPAYGRTRKVGAA